MTECPKCDTSFRGSICPCGYDPLRSLVKPAEAEPERDVKKAKERLAQLKGKFFGDDDD